MDEKEAIDFILRDYFPMVREFLGEIIEQRLDIRNYENGVLTSQLLNAARKDAACNEDEYLEGFELDSDLYSLDQTLDFGRENCKGFSLIFKDIELSQHQDADAKIKDMLAEIKAFEFLSRQDFRDITKIGQRQSERSVDFIAHKSNENYAMVVTLLSSAQYAEEHSDEYDVEAAKEWLAADISNTIDQKYPQIEEFCQRKIGTWKGVIFISSGCDYFRARKYENRLYGLPLRIVTVLLNREWRARKEGQKSHEYLHHIVITMGRNIWKAIIYPSW